MNALRIGRRPSPALILAAIALVLALGGTAAATSLRQLEAATEPYHLVGAPGEPAFGNGGQGDCIWRDAGAAVIEGLNPPSFYVDPFGQVHLSGAAALEMGTGGDGDCGGDDAAEDWVMFVLPSGYRPENVEVIGAVDDLEALVVPDEGAILSGARVPPGAVLGLSGAGITVLDGAEFTAAGRRTAIIEDSEPAAQLGSVGHLRRILD
jgi:hypothetical protein